MSASQGLPAFRGRGAIPSRSPRQGMTDTLDITSLGPLWCLKKLVLRDRSPIRQRQTAPRNPERLGTAAEFLVAEELYVVSIGNSGFHWLGIISASSAGCQEKNSLD
jgi:hypothetical protein